MCIKGFLCIAKEVSRGLEGKRERNKNMKQNSRMNKKEKKNKVVQELPNRVQEKRASINNNNNNNSNNNNNK
jgi:hypothetical protein